MAVFPKNIDHGISQAISDIQLVHGRSIQLKEEQDKAIRDLLRGKDVFAVLPTGYGKSLIYQVFVRARAHETQGNAAILVISPLNSIIKDQLRDMKQQHYPAVDASTISTEDLRECKFNIMFASAEILRNKSFQDILKDPSSPLHQNICAIVVDESHTVETWTGKRYDLLEYFISNLYINYDMKYCVQKFVLSLCFGQQLLLKTYITQQRSLFCVHKVYRRDLIKFCFDLI